MGGLARKIPVTFVTFAIATAAIAGIPPLAGFFSKDEILWFSLASSTRRIEAALHHGGHRLLPHCVLHVPPAVAHVPRQVARSHRKSSTTCTSPRSSMTSVLIVLAVLSAVGGFVAIPHYLEPVAPLPTARPDLEHFEHTVVVASVVVAFAGLLGAAFFYAAGGARARGVQARLTGVHRLLYGKYFIDELYERVIGRPLYWISDAVFLRLGDRALLDGSLNGLARLAQRSAGVLGRVQTGNVHLYAFLVLLGSIACLYWSWRHG